MRRSLAGSVVAGIISVAALAACGRDSAGGAVAADWVDGESSRLLIGREVDAGDAFEPGPLVVGDDAEWGAAWSAAGLPGDAPAVEFDQSLVIVQRTSYGSGCEPIFRRLRIDPDAFTPVELQFVGIEPGTVCAADERWYVVAVEVRRDAIPPGAVMRWGDREISVP